MRTFQIIFQNGRVQNLMAHNYTREDGAIRFRTGNDSVIEFTPAELLMIEEVEEGEFPKEPGSSQGELV